MKMWLAMKTADGDERTFELSAPRVVLGRDSRCDLRVAVPSVGPRHCEITVDGEAVRLRDLGSQTGTFHNGTRVDQATLSADDRVTIGPVTFVVRIDQKPDARSAVAEMKPQPGRAAGTTGTTRSGAGRRP